MRESYPIYKRVYTDAMSDELVLNGKTYVSSKKAAESTGYARDYIGQLSRGGLIDAERVGGLWYVSMDSLKDYEKNAEIAKTLSPVSASSKEAESLLNFEGKEYISASRASKLTGYNQDYVGQLARGGKIPSRQIGNRWYIDRDALVAHKSEKDALLAAVQAEAVGLKPSTQEHAITPIAPPEHVLALPKVTYMPEKRDLMPILPEKKEQIQYPVSNFSEIRPRSVETVEQVHDTGTEQPRIQYSEPVRISPIVQKPSFVVNRPQKSRKRPYVAASVGVLTVIIVLSVGVTALKSPQRFASIGKSVQASGMAASAGGIAHAIGDRIEDIVSPPLVYNRADN